jgi:zinc finger CCCH domain-containing protein 13
MLEGPKKKAGFEEPLMSGGLGDLGARGEEKRDPLGLTNMSNLRENPDVPGQYIGYVRNPPTPTAMVGEKK